MPKPNDIESVFLTDEMLEHQAMLDLSKYVAATGKELKFPVYPEEIIETLWSVEVEPCEKVLDHNGMPVLAYFSPSERKVFVNVSAAAENAGRASFTVAHEAGHVSLHDFLSSAEGKNAACMGYDSTSPESRERMKEYQAEQYASALLMPRDSVHSIVEEMLSRDRSRYLDLAVHERELCEYFNVSAHALEIRLDKLGIATRNAYHPKKMKRVDERALDVMEQERAVWSFRE